MDIVEERFWDRVDRSGGHESCWMWTGRTDNHGFGIVANGKNKVIKVHRYIYERYKGALSSKDLVIQSCGSKICVNPLCLIKQTKKEMLDVSWSKRNTYANFILNLAKNPKLDQGCIIFPGGKCSDGYGRVGFRGKLTGAHQLMWVFTYGPIPEGMEVCHSCDNPPCIQINHLFLDIHRGNILDMASKDRHRSRTHPEGMSRGEQHGRSKLTQIDVDKIRELLRMKVNQRIIAEAFSVHKATINNISRRKNWTYV